MPIERSEGGTTITGNAINWYRLLVAIKAAELYIKTGMKASRVATPSNIREIVSGYTGKEYARSRKGLEQAVADGKELMQHVLPDNVVPVK